MKKRILSTLLVLCMVLGMFPMTVLAGEWEGPVYEGYPAELWLQMAEDSCDRFKQSYNETDGTIADIDENEWGNSWSGRKILSSANYYLNVAKIAWASITPDHEESFEVGKARERIAAIEEYYAGIKKLDLSTESDDGSEMLYDMNVLAPFTNLEYLDFSGNHIGGGIPADLECLKTLKTLKINNCDIYDIAALANSTVLTTLELGSNDIWDITPLASCTSLTSITVPDNVANIERGAFSDCTGLTSITIPGSVTSIGWEAFSGWSNLTSVTILDGVTSIGGGAFEDCTGLTSVTIPASVTTIEAETFSGCTSLTSVTIPGSVTSIGRGAFSGTPWLEDQGEFAIVNGILIKYQGNGGDVTIPDGVTSIGGWAFEDCTGLTSVAIPDGVTSIEYGAFSGCTGLTSITIPESLTDIRGAFYGTPWLENQGEFAIVNGILIAYQGSGGSVSIPSGVTNIGWNAFMGCTDLTSVAIPGSVTSIGERAFRGCTGLTSVAIPGSVTSIEFRAFYDCTGLTDVYYGGSEGRWEAIDIASDNEPLENATIHYNSTMPQQPAESTVGGFSDVKTGAWYAESVLWAVEKEITIGTSDTTFSPDINCTQGQILTFLWRAKGEPAPVGAVSGDEYYATAAQWAAEQGLTDDFSAEADCTRAMVVTYLWKLAGSPKAASSSSFTDVPDTLADAVSWAAEQGITTGTSATTFSPDLICTRGQIVTFLYRDMAE